MTEQMKRNGAEEQLTENQRAVQAKLKKDYNIKTECMGLLKYTW